MMDILPEDDAVLSKRRAIQETMRDRSMTPAERNRRVQEIMAGRFVEAPPPPPVAPEGSPPPPAREIPRRDLSAEELVERSRKAGVEKAAPQPSTALATASATLSDFEARVRAKSQHLKSVSDPNPKASGAGFKERKAASAGESRADSALGALGAPRRRITEKTRVDANNSSLAASGAIEHVAARPGSETSTDDSRDEMMSRKATSAGGVDVDGFIADSEGTAAGQGAPRSDFMEFHKLITKKTPSHNNADGARTSTGASNSLSNLERRITEKIRTNSNESVIPGSLEDSESQLVRPGQRIMEQRILEKVRSSATVGSFSSGAASSTLGRRILDNSKSDATEGSSSANGSVGSSSSHFEQRVLDKVRSSAIGSSKLFASANVLSESNDFNASDNLDVRLERRGDTDEKVAAAAASPTKAESRKRQAIKSVMQDPGLDPQKRNRQLQAIMVGNWNETKVGWEDDMDEEAAMMAATPMTAESRKRHAIKAVMQDPGLNPQERNRRLQAIMAGNWDDNTRAREEDTAEIATVAAVTPMTAESRKRQAITAVMRDPGLDPQERNRRLQAIMAGNWEDLEEVPAATLGSSRTRRKLTTAELEAKILIKLSRRKEEDSNDGSGDGGGSDDGGVDEEEGVARGGGFSSRGDDESDDVSCGTLNMREGGGIISGRDDPLPDHHSPGVGFGSLARPEEHFAPGTADHSWNEPPEASRPTEGGVTDENFGLAVATAVSPNDEPDYVYRAIEYDPEAKPPLHLNRRFRAYAYLALLLIATAVVLVVVRVTSSSMGDGVVNEYVTYQAQPTGSPTQSPITDRQSSGITEQLEAGVLRVRNETFAEMKSGDPRLLALDWILHKDMMQLVSDDANLYQRFVLAALAYTLDSVAWYVCGNPGANYTQSECSVFVGGKNYTHGVWLSSTDECTWYGITCSSDSIVRRVDLNNNDLIGMLPVELSALRFLQILALPHNCLYGTIPPELGTMRHLLSLELHGNGLSGEIPKEMYHLNKLQLLNLADQWGSERECDTTDGSKVKINYRMGGLVWPLEENVGLIGTLGSEIGILRSLKGLYLNKNSFEGKISEEIGNMKYLRFLWLNDNFIAGSIPTTITKLRSLRNLQLGENFLISELPSDIGKLTDLDILTVNGNSMFGEIPTGLYNLKKLEVLRLEDTLMSVAPWLVVPDEGFTGSISTLIGGLEDLRWLLLSNNPLSGTIPTELGLCEKMEVLRVHRTNLNGTMPREICALRNKNLNENTGTAGVLYSDCRPNNRTGDPFLKCNCCSDCCDHTTGVCIADD